MAIKLVARPRHGQYEHNKSSYTHTRSPAIQRKRERMKAKGRANKHLLKFTPPHHNPIQPQRDTINAHRAKIITMVKGIRQRGT